MYKRFKVVVIVVIVIAFSMDCSRVLIDRHIVIHSHTHRGETPKARERESASYAIQHIYCQLFNTHTNNSKTHTEKKNLNPFVLFEMLSVPNNIQQ